MGKKLVIVESPAKAKTINKILGAEYVVAPSLGHVRDLPERKLGVDVEHGFKPEYVLVKGKQKVVEHLKKQAAACEAVYLAPDPDREGEAIAWHIAHVLKAAAGDKPFHRVQYNEITPQAVRRAFERPGAIEMRRVNAQQARRILDRIVGYMVSPMLWRKLQRGLSAGRVQSVALRLVCEREEEIRNFVPQAYWVIGARARKRVEPLDPFLLRLTRIAGEKAEVHSAEQAEAIRADLEGRELQVVEITRREISKRPQPPFITSTLQQAASSRFGFSPKRTMGLAQRLYEGVDLGEGPVGLITYMRTDSVVVAREAVEACRGLIAGVYGKEYCPQAPNVYRSRSGAQEAHEAIRPTDVSRAPESLAGRLDAAEMKLYRMIWERFVASQMTPARIEQRTVKVEALPPPGRETRYLLQATASDVRFPGYMRVTGVDLAAKKDESSEEPQRLPELQEGERLECLEWLSERKETKPPARYSEASLVRALEANGIGRPSTYAQIVATLEDRKYVVVEKRSLAPTELGLQVSKLLVSTLEVLFNVRFTADMETALDEVEAGKVEWTRMLDDFYRQFQLWMSQAKDPPADSALAGRILGLLEHVGQWAPPLKSGKRTLDDQRFVESLRKQLTASDRGLSMRQLEALAKIGARYRGQVPELATVLAEAGYEHVVNSREAQPPAESTRRTLALVKDLDLDDYARRLVDSLDARVAAGRALTDAQRHALGRVVLRHAGQIPDFETLRPSLEIEAPEPAAQDRESGELLAALKHVQTWRPPVQRGRRVFDDRAFSHSLAQHYAKRGALSERQRAALKKMLPRYREQIPEFGALAERFHLKVQQP